MRLSVLLLGLATACTGMIDVDPEPLPPKTDIEIVVRDGQSPQPGVAVLFQHADGTVAAEATTESGVDQLVLASSSSNNRTQVVASRGDYTQDTLIVDASAGLIPSVSGLSYKQAGLTWVEEGAGAADAVIASLAVTRTSPVGDNSQYVRMILAPHGGPSLSVPVLAGAAASYNPVMGDQVAARLGIATATGGYDALRPRAFSVASVVEVAPMNGQVTLSYAGAPPGV